MIPEPYGESPIRKMYGTWWLMQQLHKFRREFLLRSMPDRQAESEAADEPIMVNANERHADHQDD